MFLVALRWFCVANRILVLVECPLPWCLGPVAPIRRRVPVFFCRCWVSGVWCPGSGVFAAGAAPMKSVFAPPSPLLFSCLPVSV